MRSPSADSCPDGDAATFPALLQAYINCRRGKRNSASALEFEMRLERNLCDLYDELVSGAYQPGRSICFPITRPKPREVWAASFRDRIVHWLLYSHIAPRFHAAFVADSCACIPGRGTLYGAQRLERHVRSCTRNWARPAHYLKCDLANFFVSIDKHVLRERIAARVHEPWWMALADTILFHDPRQDVEVRGCASDLRRVPPHKSLFNAPDDTGLPIGNLSSQFFANVLLDALDQRVKHRLRAPYYIRYVDDFVLLHPSRTWLTAAHHDIETWLPEQLRLQLNPRKTIRQPVDRGLDFVGQVISPWRRTTRRRTLASALQRIEQMPADALLAAGNSYLGLVRQATHSHTERAALCRALLKRGHAVEGMHLSKVFRKAAA
ncbi:RNA-directed DNA polymerase [Alicycliphilus denitrificans]|uniref:RNA-directed DNA polymerase n=1 Tax=Alicycliphilus denitrificans TaxID=179636 RepID=UPI0001DA0DFC|nr:RNA-directed DNA polymerase [Alicycliphilus denitrificans]ADV01304.1 retron-type reverse transcriptase [Alicycliphilus denitrificans BC]